MNVSNDFKCSVCGKITRIKVQMGWLENYPISIKCNECHISIFGKVNLNSNSDNKFIELENVTPERSGKTPDFIIEVSGELLTEKLREYTGGIDLFFSPFIKNLMVSMEQGEFFEFKDSILNFLFSVKNNWPAVKRINELWLNQNYKYLPSELHKILNKTEYPSDNLLEFLRGVHGANWRFLHPIFNKYFFETADFLFDNIEKLNKKDSEQFKELVLSFEDKLNIYEEKIYMIMCKFIEKFEMFIPVLSLEFHLNSNKEEYMKKMGLTTVDFEDIKGYYIDTFEDIVEVFDLVLAYENFSVRNDYTQMDSDINKSIKTLEDFQQKMSKKGKKIEFIDSLKVFNQMFTLKIDNRLRNAIGHRSYKYDVQSQRIDYYPSGTMDKGELETIYLTEFVYKCLQLFKTCMGIGELIYQTRKFLFVFQGQPIRRVEDYYPDLSKNENFGSGNNNLRNKEKKVASKLKNKRKNARKSRKINRKKK